MKVFSLFTGIGGFDLAAQRLGHEIIGACEIDKYARSIYSRHFPGVTIYKDATKIKPEELPDFELLCAGFPCQAFSIAGKRLGFEESRGTLFFEIARITKQKRPRLLLLENVKGLLSHDRGKTFANILATLDELGYDAEWQVLNSKYFVPQNRERIFIIAYLRGEPRPEVFPIREDESNSNGECKKQKELQMEITSAIDASYYKGPDGKRTMIYMSQKNSNMKQRIQQRDTTWTLTNNGNDFGIVEPQLKRIEGKPNVYKTDAQAGKIYDTTGISPTVSGQRVNSQDWIKEEPKLQQLNNPKHSSHRVYSSDGISRTLKANTGAKTGLYAVEPKIKSLGNLPIPFMRRKTEPQQLIICKFLKDNKTVSLSELSTLTKITKTQLEHYFRSDQSGALPNKNDWLKLKEIMNFDDTFDEIMTEYVEDTMTHEMGTRVHDSDGIAPTLTGGEKLINDKISKIRRLTPLECERLQGFPDDYTKYGQDEEIISDTQRYKACGNAVTVPVIEFILERLK